MVDLASEIAPFLPTRLLVCDQFDNLDKVSRLHIPTLLVHGTADSVVPAHMGLRLARRISDVSVTLIPEANHNDVYDVGGEELIRKIVAFVRTAETTLDQSRKLGATEKRERYAETRRQPARYSRQQGM